MGDGVAEGGLGRRLPLPGDSVPGGHVVDGFGVAGESDDPGVEESRVPAHALGGVPLGVQGDEHGAHLLRLLVLQRREARADPGERQRTDVGARGEAEEQQHHLAPVVAEIDRPLERRERELAAGGHVRPRCPRRPSAPRRAAPRASGRRPGRRGRTSGRTWHERRPWERGRPARINDGGPSVGCPLLASGRGGRGARAPRERCLPEARSASSSRTSVMSPSSTVCHFAPSGGESNRRAKALGLRNEIEASGAPVFR